MSVRVAWTRKRDEVGSLAGFFPYRSCAFFLLIVIFEQPPAREPFFSAACARAHREPCAWTAHDRSWACQDGNRGHNPRKLLPAQSFAAPRFLDNGRHEGV